VVWEKVSKANKTFKKITALGDYIEEEKE